jgi:UDP-N-acetylglucosamine 2-epimerase (hydrolysing)
MKRIVFITGTRADYGKIKPLIKCVEASNSFEAYIYVSGMHLLEMFGNTYEEIIKDGYKNIQIAYGLANTRDAGYDVGDVICNFTGYVRKIKPDMIVVHGDRIDALAGAIVGALSNIIVAHIEGGEISGTIDESIRHAISKFAHIHFVSNEKAKKRLLQLGEDLNRIFVIGSPDIDVMISKNLPSKKSVMERYDIPFEEYAILMYHPVTTEYNIIGENVKNVVDAIIDSGKNYIVIYPNNDMGYEIILNEYRRFEGNSRFRVFPSLRFEYFLTLLKNADFIIGNSSAGIRESSVYGVPAIDIGNRQFGRYSDLDNPNIQHVCDCAAEIKVAIEKVYLFRAGSHAFGEGDSASKFMEIINDDSIWNIDFQKQFHDID